MSDSKDWIPDGINEFKTFGDTFCTLASTNKTTWGLDTQKVADLLTQQTKFNGYYDISKDHKSRSTVDVENTNDARVPYEQSIRNIGQHEMKYNTLMTDTERTACGVHIDSGTHTPAPIETTSPVIQYAPAGRLGGKVTFAPVGSGYSGAKPEGQQGVRIKIGFYKQGDTVPTEDLCPQTEIVSNSPASIVFSNDYYGMMFVGYARYFNTRKQLATVSTQFFGVVA